MKAKIFYFFDKVNTQVEKELNKWFEENPNIQIKGISHVEEHHRYWTIIILYEESETMESTLKAAGGWNGKL